MSNFTRAQAWLRSFWLYQDGSVCQTYLFLLGMALLITVCSSILGGDIVKPIILFLLPGLLIASLVKHVLWQSEQLKSVCSTLQMVAVQKCICQLCPEMRKGGCYVCNSRHELKEHFPGKLPRAIRSHVLSGGLLTEDLASCLSESDKSTLKEELKTGWNTPFYPE